MARRRKAPIPPLVPLGSSQVMITGGDALRAAGLPFNRMTKDFHGETAAALQVTRDQAKQINYAIMYGGLQVPVPRGLDDYRAMKLCGGCILEAMVRRQHGPGAYLADGNAVHADHCLVPLAREAEAATKG